MDSIAAVVDAIRGGEVSAVETVTGALDAAEASQPSLNAFTTIDRRGALSRAAKIDERICW